MGLSVDVSVDFMYVLCSQISYDFPNGSSRGGKGRWDGWVPARGATLGTWAIGGRTKGPHVERSYTFCTWSSRCRSVEQDASETGCGRPSQARPPSCRVSWGFSISDGTSWQMTRQGAARIHSPTHTRVEGWRGWRGCSGRTSYQAVKLQGFQSFHGFQSLHDHNCLTSDCGPLESFIRHRLACRMVQCRSNELPLGWNGGPLSACISSTQ